MKIYVASSWRNFLQPSVVRRLRDAGHKVYDFRALGSAFAWRSISAAWEFWNGSQFREALAHPIAKKGFLADFQEMLKADAFVLVLPCGRSAHLELGWAAGQKKKTIVLLSDRQEPELMYLLADHICTSLDEVIKLLEKVQVL